jgi:uncharacterized protein YndB with AHSA1/START domain
MWYINQMVRTTNCPHPQQQLSVAAEATVPAPPDQVWALISDARRYPQWGPWSEGGYRRPGDASERGPGAVQWLKSAQRNYGRRTVSVERIVIAEEPRRLVYEVVSGLPMRHYRGEVTLTPAPGGTHVHWAASWDRTASGRLVHRALARFFPEMLAGLTGYAARQAG